MQGFHTSRSALYVTATRRSAWIQAPPSCQAVLRVRASCMQDAPRLHALLLICTLSIVLHYLSCQLSTVSQVAAMVQYCLPTCCVSSCHIGHSNSISDFVVYPWRRLKTAGESPPRHSSFAQCRLTLQQCFCGAGRGQLGSHRHPRAAMLRAS